MNQRGIPTQFLYGFDHASYVEHDALVVVLGSQPYFKVLGRLSAQEVILVVDEVDLHSGRLKRGDFYDEGMVGIVDDYVHS